MHCPHCSREIADHQAFCQYCGGSTAGEGAQSGAGRSRTPWENRDAEGFIGGLLRTLRFVLLSPAGFFRAMPVRGGLTDPLLFALIIGMAGLIASYVWQILLQGTMEGFIPAEMRPAAGYDALQGAGIALMAVIAPVMLIAYIFIWSGIVHLCLMMVNGARSGFEATFRTVAYSHSVMLLMAVPVCGGIIAAVWSIVLIIIGLKHSHEISGGKAAFAELFPLTLCCGLAIAAAAFMGLMAASAAGMLQL